MIELNAFFERLKNEFPGFSITISDSTKRSDGEWHARWTYEVRNSNREIIFRSEWWGHETADEALFQLLKDINTKKIDAHSSDQEDEDIEWGFWGLI